MLTAKKVSEILEVSLDELLSGEESVKFIEENPIVTSTTVSAIQAGFYGFSGMCFTLFSIIWITVFIMDFGQYERELIPQVITKACSDFSMTVLMLTGLVFSVKGKLTPKKTAILPVLYSILKIVSIVTTNYFVYTEFGLTVKLIMMISINIFFHVLNIIFIIGYFLKDRMKYRYCIYIFFSIIILNQGIMLMQKLLASGMEFFSYFNFVMDIISLLGISGFAGLVIYQTHTLYKKRYQAAKTV